MEKHFQICFFHCCDLLELFSLFLSGTNLNGPNGQQQTNPYYADYDHGPWNEPRQLNPFQPSNGRSVGGPGGSYPMIQQVRLTV